MAQGSPTITLKICYGLRRIVLLISHERLCVASLSRLGETNVADKELAVDLDSPNESQVESD